MYYLFNMCIKMQMFIKDDTQTNGSHFPVYSEEVAFAHHFVGTHLLPPSHPIGLLMVLAMPVKYLKWQAIQIAIHSIVGEQIDNK